MNVNIPDLNASVMEIVTDFSEEYEATESVDHATRCSNLKPGTPIPAKGGIKLTENQQHIESYGFEAAEKIGKLCDMQRDSVLKSMSTPPSDEALRMMQSISLRSEGVTVDELDALSAKYGSNYQVRKFLASEMRTRELGYPSADECDTALRQIEHARSVGLKGVKASRFDKSTMSKASRLAVLKQELNGEGLFAF